MPLSTAYLVAATTMLGKYQSPTTFNAASFQGPRATPTSLFLVGREEELYSSRERREDRMPRMARRANVSEDGLPELSSIFGTLTMETAKKRAGKAVKAMAERATGEKIEIVEEDEVLQKAKPRRRVLNSTSDNPLLRPLGKEAGKEKGRRQMTVSSALVAVSSGVGVVERGGSEEMQGSLNGTERSLNKLMSRGTTKPLIEPPPVNEVGEQRKSIKEKKVAKILLKQVQSEDEDAVGPRIRRTRKVKPAPTARAETPEELDDSPVEDLSDNMSDFIVSDNSSEEEFEEEDDHSPAPKSVRKLVRGRRPDALSQKEDPTANSRRDFHFSQSDNDTKDESLIPPPVSRRLFSTEIAQDISDFEEESPILSYDPADNKSRCKPNKEARFTTPPSSPKKTLVSPKKFPRIPSTPHRQSSDDFWKPDVVNDWNDEFSPQKPLRPLSLRPGPDDPIASPQKASPAKKDKKVVEAKKKFNENKHSIAESFLRELDEVITDGKIAALSSSTGGVSIEWSKKLNTTAGRANWRREGIRSKMATTPGAPSVTYRHHASIELAEKVIDDEHRLLNVVAHEFCHLANFMVSGVTNNPHGKEFKVWATRCTARFGARGVEVTTKHSYEIAFKYVWQCSVAGCGMEFKRHSKSIDPKRHTCGLCRGRLVQTKPAPRGDGAGGKGMGEYQAYVKDNIGRVRKENIGSPQKDIMTLLGKGYREMKALKLKDIGKDALGPDGAADAKEVEEVDSIDSIVKKIDFLDLTTP